MSESEVKSPIKGMPDCWQDEKRMNSLFLPFKKKELNPVDWESKMKFWRGSVEQWSLQKEDCLVSVKKLEAEFKRKERVPMCLATVIDNLLRSGDLKPKDEFLNLNPQQTWTNWAINSFVKVPVVWSFTKIKEALLEVDDTQIEYVYLAYLKNRGDILLSAIRSRNASLLSLEEILHILTEEGYCVSIETLNFIIHWLQIQRLAVLINFEKRILVKFSADNKPVINISEAEAAAITLQQTTVALKKNIESLELEKQQTIDEARNYVKKGMRQSAKSCLRKKRELEKCIEKRVSALDNAEVLLSRLKDSESDSKVLDAYRMGLSALKVTFKNAGLTEDSVINTMAEVQEVIDVHEEIQSALSQSITPVVDDELEKELSELLDNNKVTPDQFLSELPRVPTELPPVKTDKFKEIKKSDCLALE